MLLKRRIFALKRNSLTPIVTHNMAADANDPILNQIRRVKPFNDLHDRVKVIFLPDILNSNNPILGLDYEEFARGCHLGVFPSYYEVDMYEPSMSSYPFCTSSTYPAGARRSPQKSKTAP